MSTSKVVLIIVIAIGLIAGGLSFLPPPQEESYESNLLEKSGPSEEIVPSVNEVSEKSEVSEEKKEEVSKGSEEKKEIVIEYTNSGYSPNSLAVKKGDTIMWVNKSSRDMWPASAKHPTHEIYPQKGGCIGSAFDACGAIKPGSSWKFTFDIAGTWKYHDHLAPSYFGTIIVE